MKILFFSNFLNHHQLPLCQALYRLTCGNFIFVATTRVPKERLSFGYADMNHEHPFVLRTYEGQAQKQRALQLALEADIVIWGSAPYGYIKERLKYGMTTFMYSERLYKTGYQSWKWPVRTVRIFSKFGKYKCLYLLCASAYTAYDFSKTFTFLGKSYKWGYFPAIKIYDLDVLMERKKPNRILWAGRFLELKHPEYSIEVARRLKSEGYDFQLTMLGHGELLEETRQQVVRLGLEDVVSLPGAVPADEVRSYMEESAIYMFTSDRNEGWGAVLNESMNSGCAVVACNAIGSVPFLIQDGENGLTYDNGDVEGLYNHVKRLLDKPEECRSLGRKAYKTMSNLWNAEIAAERLLQLSEALLHENCASNLFLEGPCSRAEIIKDN